MKTDTFFRNLQSYYGVQRYQFFGFLLVLGAIAVLKLGSLFFFEPKFERDREAFLAWIDSVEALEEEPFESKFASKSVFTDTSAKLFAFDPNQVSISQMKDLGFPQWLAERIEKFRNKNGKFRKKEDLAKIYDFPDALYQRLEPYITLPNPDKTPTQSTRQSPAKFELNTADTTLLVAIKGIASKRAMAIVTYREKLGGFYDYGQLSEIFVLKNSPEVIENIKTKTTLDPSLIRKIQINTADTSTLRQHPYLGFKRAKALALFRQNHGRFNSLQDLKKVYALDSTTLQKISPYLSFE
jgi:DNA uptake protein ComE-like DNA-binding protein